MLSLKFLPFTPTLTNFATERAKLSGPTEKFLEKYRFCPKTAHSVVQKGKRKMQVFENKHLHFVRYTEDYLFSNRFMEDLAKIYRLRKYFPSFDD